MPLSLRWEFLKMKYWARATASGDNYPGKALFANCWEYLKLDGNSTSPPFGLATTTKEMGLDYHPVNPHHKISIWAPWPLEPPRLHVDLWGKSDTVNPAVTCNQAIEFINSNWSQSLHVYTTDGSKEPSGRTAAAICIPDFRVVRAFRLTIGYTLPTEPDVPSTANRS